MPIRILVVNATDTGLNMQLSAWKKRLGVSFLKTQSYEEACTVIRDLSYIEAHMDAMFIHCDRPGTDMCMAIDTFAEAYPVASMAVTMPECQSVWEDWFRSQDVELFGPTFLPERLEEWLAYLSKSKQEAELAYERI